VSFQEDFDNTFFYGRKAMALLKKNKTPATPENYALWYNYALGQNKNLIKAVHSIQTETGELGGHDAQKIYREYISELKLTDQMDELNNKMGDEVEQITTMIKASLSATSTYGDSMGMIGRNLDQVRNSEQLKTIVKSIVHATRNMEANTRDLESKLDNSRQKIAELKQNLENVRAESRTDSLTGITNRMGFDEQMLLLTDQAAKEGHELCLLLGDIDHFKKFNATFGHQTGDQVLRLVAKTISANVKGRDVAARYGGEEFVVILPKTNLRSAITVANQIREAVQAKELIKRSTGESLGTITLSFGAARFIAGETVDSFIKRADVCLYAAKTAGRNQVKSETDPDVEASAAA
jgi:diguanylate cyclase